MAITEVGDATTVDWAALTAPTVKVTVAVCVTITPSVVSVAVKTGAPAVDDFTVKVTTPEASLAPEASEIVSVAPRLDTSVTVLFVTALLLPSFKVTVIVERVVPSASTEVGSATTVEAAALAPKVTPGFVLSSTLSPVAVKTDAPAVREVTVKVTTPEALDGPEAAEIVSVTPRLESSETVLFVTGLLWASNRVTVTVEAAVPFADTVAGEATTVEVPAFTAPAVKVTVAV